MIVFKASTLVIVLIVVNTARSAIDKKSEIVHETVSDGHRNVEEAHNKHPAQNILESWDQQHVAAKCEGLLKEEYDSDKKAGLKNFKIMYNTSSENELQEKLHVEDIKDEDWNSEFNEEIFLKVLKYSFSAGYMFCLANDNGLAFENGQLPLDFCKDEAKRVHTELNEKNCEGQDLTYEEIFDICKTYVMKLGFSVPIERIVSKKHVLLCLFQNWSYNTLKYEKFIQLNVDIQTSEGTDELKKVFFDRFSLGYFSLFGKVVENVVVGQGTFKSVGEFCHDYGMLVFKVALKKKYQI